MQFLTAAWALFTPLNIFLVAGTIGNLVLYGAVVYLLYTEVRRRLKERKNIAAFEASLPEAERKNFRLVYKQRTRGGSL